MLVENRYTAIAAVGGFMLMLWLTDGSIVWRPGADRRNWVGCSTALKLIDLPVGHSDQPIAIGEVELRVHQSLARGIRPRRANSGGGSCQPEPGRGNGVASPPLAANWAKFAESPLPAPPPRDLSGAQARVSGQAASLRLLCAGAGFVRRSGGTDDQRGISRRSPASMHEAR